MIKQRSLLLLFALLIGAVWGIGTALVQAEEQMEVVVTADMPLRALAGQFLDNPDAWRVILYYNGLQQLTDLQPGTKLTIPVGIFTRLITQLEHVSAIISNATLEGAGVLAKESLETAAAHQVEAVRLKNDGKLEAAAEEAQQAAHWAKKALTEAHANKIRSVSAVLAQKVGTVQSRKSAQPAWLEVLLNQGLVEQERVRTLTASGAAILFIDESRIELDEQSLIVIGEMKEHQIKRTFKAEVTVIEGDILAHLSSLGGQKEFTINSPGIRTEVRSRKFRTVRDASQETRIANYDGEIDVEAQQAKVTVKKDEGAKIKYGQAPEAPVKLLPPPIVSSPQAGQILLSTTVRFAWEPCPQAKLYHIEISPERDFTHLLTSARVTQPSYDWQAPERGRYFYRIYAIDHQDFSGPFSDPAELYVEIDVTAPYLSVASPAEAEVILGREVLVRGTIEQAAVLHINAVRVEPDADGTFAHLTPLEPGEQTIRITATDRAGNQTAIVRHVTCNLEEHLVTLTTPNPLVVNLSQIPIQGTLRPLASVTINDQPAATTAGHFATVLALPEGEHDVLLNATTPSGMAQQLTLRVIVDLTPPELLLDPVPAVTRQTVVHLTGKTSETVTLSINTQNIPLQQQHFAVPLQLREGENQFELRAVDLAGNLTARTISILADTTPPYIEDYRCSAPEVQGGQILACEVKALDDGIGLAKTGRFTVAIAPAATVLEGILTFNSVKAVFVGSVFIPLGVTGQVKLQAFYIQDRLGNEMLGP